MRNALKDLPENGSALLREEYMTDLALYTAAIALQVLQLETASMSESLKNVMLVQMHGYDIPDVNVSIIRRQTAVMHFEDGAFQAWFEVVRLVGIEGSWDVRKPLFGQIQGFEIQALDPSSKLPCGEESFVTHKVNEVGAQWHFAMIGDAFLSSLGKVSTCVNSKRDLIHAIRLFLQQHLNGDGKVPHVRESVASGVVAIYRGCWL